MNGRRSLGDRTGNSRNDGDLINLGFLMSVCVAGQEGVHGMS